MTKQEKIQDAYGIHWGFYKDKVDENGWINCRKLGHGNLIPIMEVKDIQFQEYKQRPKLLQGIEENNGWTKIETIEDLPVKGYYDVVIRETQEITRATLNNKFVKRSQIKCYSHYKEIIQPLLPLY